MSAAHALRRAHDPTPQTSPSSRDRAAVIAEAIGCSRTIAQVLIDRGLTNVDDAREFVDPRLSLLTPPDSMADRAEAAARLARAIEAGERIAIFGDYDVDGTTSTAILADSLEAMGGVVSTALANRFDGGYGLSERALARVLESRPRVLVTCDCGSSDHPRIERARAAGIDVIVVDHHLVPREPLPAIAFLNPHRPECGFPYKGLCSAGLALSLAAAVRAELGAKIDLRPMLDLVALGTIADVAPLDGDNRRLVRAGLARLAQPTRPGVIALQEQARIRAGTPIGGMDVAFRLAPRLNAAGRLGDPSLALGLLRARTLDEARARAACIEAVNTDRKEITRRITEAAIAQVREIYPPTAKGGIVVAGEGWHRGVVGIVAARLVDLFEVPAVVIALEEGSGHGSARTPEGFRLYDAIARCQAELEAFGGHQAAAGVTIRSERLERFRTAFFDACVAVATERELGGGADGACTRPAEVEIDGSRWPLPNASELALLEPLGAGNPEPRFVLRDVRVEHADRVGDDHLKLEVRSAAGRLACFGWQLGSWLEQIDTSRRIDVVGALRPDAYRGGEQVELRLIELRSGGQPIGKL